MLDFFFSIINLHPIFWFLGKPQGELVKKIVELLLLIFISYMVTSEFTKSKNKQLKYLSYAFGSFAFQRLFIVVVLMEVLFGNLGMLSYTAYTPIIDGTLELFALMMISIAFLYPFLKKYFLDFKKVVFYSGFWISFVFFILQTIFIFEHETSGKLAGILYLSSSVFVFFKILLLLFVILVLSTRTDVKVKYRYSIIVAFLVYLIAPLLNLINIIFYSNANIRLIVAAHPFPLLAIALFARVIYLKLVDKAYLKKKVKEAEEKYEHEKELGKIKDKFVSVVSHELRTPLTSINLYSSLLRDGKLGKINPKQKNAASVVKDETTRLSTLINDILDLSRLEEGKLKLRLSIFDLYSFVESSPSSYLARQKGIKIINNVPKDLKIKVDPEKFQQILVNLISNATKFTEKGGKITINCKSKKGNYEISVEDTGSGIPKKELEKIFDKFYQVEHYMTRKEGGSGLGLAIVYELIKLHKGDIKVTSKVGKGTKFTIIIPKTL